jgi:serine/threonine protein kinase
MAHNPSQFGTTLEKSKTFKAISSYRLIRRLGEGGMGEVWLAERFSEGRHSQQVAVKFIYVTGHSLILAEEAFRMSHLSHDNIVPFIDSGHDSEGRFFVAMAYVEGMDLNRLRERVGLTSEAAYKGKATGRVPDLIVGFLMFMVLRALHHAHTYNFGHDVVGLIHRDVSPGNILINNKQGFVKLTDFGVAVRQTSEEYKRGISGKVPYMAPEVLVDEEVDTRSDIYSLGLVAYELLTGFNPNVHPMGLVSVISAITTVMLALEQPLRPPHEVIEGVNPELSRIVTKMLSFAPDDRYRSADRIIADIVPVLYGAGVGPGSEALVAYLELLSSPEKDPPNRIRSILEFLIDSDGTLNIRPEWTPTPVAREAIAAGRNPGRVFQGNE